MIDFSLVARTSCVHSIKRGPKHVMREVGFGFRSGHDREAPRHCAKSETGDLWKYEPHPVRLLPTARELLDHMSIQRLLRVDEASKIERIAQWLLLP